MNAKQRITELLSTLVKIKSYVDKENDEREMVKFISEFFQNLKKIDSKININVQDVEGERKNIIISKGIPNILFECHTDTVPPGNLEDWKLTKPFEPKEIEGNLYGRGSCDMKGSIATILTLAETLVKENKFNNLILLFDVDEEYQFKGIKKFLQETKIKPKQVLCLEPTDLKISNKHRGLVEIEVKTYGVSAHAGKSLQGLNAIEILTKALEQVNKEVISDKYKDVELGNASFNLAYIRGGKEGTYNSVPSESTAVIDIRPTPKLSSKLIEKQIKDAVFNETKKVFNSRKELINKKFEEIFKQPEIKYNINYDALFCKEEEINEFIKHCKKFVKSVEFSMSTGFTEAGIFANHFKIPAFNFGPSFKATTHTSEENVKLSDLAVVYEVLKNFMTEAAQ